MDIKAFKMDGLGNDFLIIDRRKKSISIKKEKIIELGKRDNIGFDQLIFIDEIDNDTPSYNPITIYNSDGEKIAACGNGSRCVAYLLMKEKNQNKISLKTKAGILEAELDQNNLVSINMGQPNFIWEKIPLSKNIDNKNLKIKITNNFNQTIEGGFSLSVGNPHVVFFVDDFNKYNLAKIGPEIENHNYFPKKCNVTLATIINKKSIKVKVWERGAGLTMACGTAACATAVAASVLNLTDRSTNIDFKKGILNINWKLNNNIYMTGKVSEIKKITINI